MDFFDFSRQPKAQKKTWIFERNCRDSPKPKKRGFLNENLDFLKNTWRQPKIQKNLDFLRIFKGCPKSFKCGLF